MRAGQAEPALEVGRLGRSSNCSSLFPTKGRCGSHYRPLLAPSHKPPPRGSRTSPVLNEQGLDLKIQAASLCEAGALFGVDLLTDPARPTGPRLQNDLRILG